MRYTCALIAMFCLLLSCQPEKGRPIGDPVATDATTAVSEANKSGNALCFKNNATGTIRSINLVVQDLKVSGSFTMKEAGANVSGSLAGDNRTEDIICDMVYEVNGIAHQEKVIVNVTGNSISLARSGSVNIDGKREQRNGGDATMDVLTRVDCN